VPKGGNDMEFITEISGDLLFKTWETIYMVLAATLFSTALGLPIGIALILTEKGGLWEKPKLNGLLSWIVNMTRSIPFIILMIILFPLSRVIVGTTIGTSATVVPLSIAAAPFVGRIVESALKEVDKGILEAVQAMGASKFEIVVKVLLPEALPGLILGMTLMVINLIGYSAMAGINGGGGLGDLAIRYGLHRNQSDVLYASVVVIIILVQIVQASGNAFANRILKNR